MLKIVVCQNDKHGIKNADKTIMNDVSNELKKKIYDVYEIKILKQEHYWVSRFNKLYKLIEFCKYDYLNSIFVNKFFSDYKFIKNNLKQFNSINDFKTNSKIILDKDITIKMVISKLKNHYISMVIITQLLLIKKITFI